MMNPPYAAPVIGRSMADHGNVTAVAARPVADDRELFSGRIGRGSTTTGRAGILPHRRMLLPLILCNLENGVRLALPFVIGLAVAGLIEGSYLGLAVLIAQQLAVLLLTSIRRMVVVRAAVAVRTDLAGVLPSLSAEGSSRRDQDLSRSAELRCYVERLQEWLPRSFSVLYAVIGGAVALALYDWTLIAGCLALLVPTALIAIAHSRTGGGNPELSAGDRAHERHLLQQGNPTALSQWHAELGHRQVGLIDGATMNRALIDLFTLSVIAASLVQMFADGVPPHGQLLAMVLYLGFFVRGLQHVPALLDEFRCLQNAGRRIRAG